jgi:hypothetical protein
MQALFFTPAKTNKADFIKRLGCTITKSKFFLKESAHETDH